LDCVDYYLENFVNFILYTEASPTKGIVFATTAAPTCCGTRSKKLRQSSPNHVVFLCGATNNFGVVFLVVLHCADDLKILEGATNGSLFAVQ
jgi:hypothetical protein